MPKGAPQRAVTISAFQRGSCPASPSAASGLAVTPAITLLSCVDAADANSAPTALATEGEGQQSSSI